MNKVVNRRFAKSKEYAQVLKTIEQKGECPFCPTNFQYSKKPILKSAGAWFAVENSWPYKNSQKHLLFISATHKENFSELSVGDFVAVAKLTRWAIKKFQIKGGALALRFGKTDYTGATVCHLHFHIIYPHKGSKRRPQTVNFPIG